MIAISPTIVGLKSPRIPTQVRQNQICLAFRLSKRFQENRSDFGSSGKSTRHLSERDSLVVFTFAKPLEFLALTVLCYDGFLNIAAKNSFKFSPLTFGEKYESRC